MSFGRLLERRVLRGIGWPFCFDLQGPRFYPTYASTARRRSGRSAALLVEAARYTNPARDPTVAAIGTDDFGFNSTCRLLPSESLIAPVCVASSPAYAIPGAPMQLDSRKIAATFALTITQNADQQNAPDLLDATQCSQQRTARFDLN